MQKKFLGGGQTGVLFFRDLYAVVDHADEPRKDRVGKREQIGKQLCKRLSAADDALGNCPLYGIFRPAGYFSAVREKLSVSALS